ncbi:hypothetical protein V8C44DRAFT_15141 [Trichoderma aethiopicum]
MEPPQRTPRLRILPESCPNGALISDCGVAGMRVPSGKGLAVDWQHLEPTCGMVSGFPSIQPSQPAGPFAGPVPMHFPHHPHSTLYTLHYCYCFVFSYFRRSSGRYTLTHDKSFDTVFAVQSLLSSDFFFLLPRRDSGRFPPWTA